MYIKKYLLRFLSVLLIFSLIGCMPTNVKMNVGQNQFTSNSRTNLVAGMTEVIDNRPEKEKSFDKYYDRKLTDIIGENFYKNMKLSGMFNDVFYGKYDKNEVDIFVTPSVDHFYYEARANGWTAFQLIFAFTGFPGLIYILAGGPGGEHYAEANLGLVMTTLDGNKIASGKGEKVITKLSNIHNISSSGVGVLDGKVLSDATYDTISSLASNISVSELPDSKREKISQCGSDNDCKGTRICVNGKCVNPETSNTIDTNNQQNLLGKTE